MPRDPGGILQALAVFFGLIVLGALIDMTVIDDGLRPLLTFANGMEHQSSASQTGLSWFTDWINLWPLLVLLIASLTLLHRAVFQSRGL